MSRSRLLRDEACRDRLMQVEGDMLLDALQAEEGGVTAR